MYILALILMLKIYQTRHPDINASAHSAYMVMAVVILAGVTGVVRASLILHYLSVFIHSSSFTLVICCTFLLWIRTGCCCYNYASKRIDSHDAVEISLLRYCLLNIALHFEKLNYDDYDFVSCLPF